MSIELRRKVWKIEKFEYGVSLYFDETEHLYLTLAEFYSLGVKEGDVISLRVSIVQRERDQPTQESDAESYEDSS